MAIFAVHYPTGETDAAAAFERSRFVKLGFSWAAFLFGPVWLLARRLWRPLALFVLGAALVGFAVEQGALGAGTAIWLYVAYAFYLGFEGRAFLGAALARRGRPLADVVCAADVTSAELGFLSRGPAQVAPPAAPPSGGPPRFPPPQVIGLFPEAGR
jgi:hypothetical protein